MVTPHPERGCPRTQRLPPLNPSTEKSTLTQMNTPNYENNDKDGPHKPRQSVEEDEEGVGT